MFNTHLNTSVPICRCVLHHPNISALIGPCVLCDPRTVFAWSARSLEKHAGEPRLASSRDFVSAGWG